VSDPVINVYIFVPTEYAAAKPELIAEIVLAAKLSLCEDSAAGATAPLITVQVMMSYGCRVITGRWFAHEKADVKRDEAWVSAVSQSMTNRIGALIKTDEFRPPEKITIDGFLTSSRFKQGVF
jgi:hypothetical protein